MRTGLFVHRNKMQKIVDENSWHDILGETSWKWREFHSSIGSSAVRNRSLATELRAHHFFRHPLSTMPLQFKIPSSHLDYTVTKYAVRVEEFLVFVKCKYNWYAAWKIQKKSCGMCCLYFIVEFAIFFFILFIKSREKHKWNINCLAIVQRL